MDNRNVHLHIGTGHCNILNIVMVLIIINLIIKTFLNSHILRSEIRCLTANFIKLSLMLSMSALTSLLYF